MSNIRTAIACALLAASMSYANAQGNSVQVISKKEFVGPEGVHLSCFQLACFEDGNSHGAPIIKTDRNGANAWLDKEKTEFGVRFAAWTPAVVDFLKEAVDRCTSEAQPFRNILGQMLEPDKTYCSMSPTRAKELLDGVYRVASQLKEQEQTQARLAASSEAARKREAERQSAANESRLREDIDRGYKHISIVDFELDSPQMSAGTKLGITGFYRVDGQLEILVEMPRPNAPKVYIVTSAAPRDSRRRFLECRRALCRVTVVGHVSMCDLSWLGKQYSRTTCLIVDDTWGR